MASVAILPSVEVEQPFSISELYELQKRRGKPASPNFSYTQRNSLKAKFRKQNYMGSSLRHSLFVLFQDTFGLINAMLALDLSYWLGQRLWGYQFRATDISSGRSRFAYLRPSAPRELSKAVYDPYQVDQ